MIVIPVVDGNPQQSVPADAVRTELAPEGLRVYLPGDALPEIPVAPDPDAELREQYRAEKDAAEAAEFAAYKARAGQPAYKAAAVKVAAEKLGVLALIEAAIQALVEKAADKALYIWWVETDAISRGDAQWQEIEAAVAWGKATAGDLFDMAAQI